MLTSSTGTTALLALAGQLLFASSSTAGYALEDDYSPSAFFSMFDFFTGADPTNGYVTYVDQGTAQSSGLINTNNGAVYMGVDSTNVASGSGRASVRVTSQKSYNHGLIVLDLAHMPGGVCGTWPAFWTVGPGWPDGGEIDIIEGVNSQSTNAMTLHTDDGCTIANNGMYSGTMTTSNCNVAAPGQATNAGCQITTSNTASFGTGFNADNGGVYATEWTSEAISIWFFPRGAIPSDITAGNPDPTGWGTATASFSGGCDIDAHFENQQIVFDTTFCGDWAGNVWSTDPICSSKASTCTQFVQNNPSAFVDAYWSINSLKVYQSNGATPSISSVSSVQPAPSSIAASSAVPFSISSSSSVPVSSYVPPYVSSAASSSESTLAAPTTSAETSSYTFPSYSRGFGQSSYGFGGQSSFSQGPGFGGQTTYSAIGEPSSGGSVVVSTAAPPAAATTSALGGGEFFGAPSSSSSSIIISSSSTTPLVEPPTSSAAATFSATPSPPSPVAEPTSVTTAALSGGEFFGSAAASSSSSSSSSSAIVPPPLTETPPPPAAAPSTSTAAAVGLPTNPPATGESLAPSPTTAAMTTAAAPTNPVVPPPLESAAAASSSLSTNSTNMASTGCKPPGGFASHDGSQHFGDSSGGQHFDGQQFGGGHSGPGAYPHAPPAYETVSALDWSDFGTSPTSTAGIPAKRHDAPLAHRRHLARHLQKHGAGRL